MMYLYAASGSSSVAPPSAPPTVAETARSFQFSAGAIALNVAIVAAPRANCAPALAPGADARKGRRRIVTISAPAPTSPPAVCASFSPAPFAGPTTAAVLRWMGRSRVSIFWPVCFSYSQFATRCPPSCTNCGVAPASPAKKCATPRSIAGRSSSGSGAEVGPARSFAAS